METEGLEPSCPRDRIYSPARLPLPPTAPCSRARSAPRSHRSFHRCCREKQHRRRGRGRVGRLACRTYLIAVRASHAPVCRGLTLPSVTCSRRTLKERPPSLRYLRSFVLVCCLYISHSGTVVGRFAPCRIPPYPHWSTCCDVQLSLFHLVKRFTRCNLLHTDPVWSPWNRSLTGVLGKGGCVVGGPL